MTTNEKCSHCNSTFGSLFLLTAKVFDFVPWKFYFTDFSTCVAKVWTFHWYSKKVVLITDMYLK